MSVHDATSGTLGAGCTIRLATADDAEALAQVGAATFLETYAGWLPGRDVLEHCRHHHTAAAYRRLLGEPESVAWIVEAADAPVGYLAMTGPDFPGKLLRQKDVELKRIYLLTRFQSRGLGRALLEKAIHTAVTLGKDRMLVGLHRENSEARRFYQRQGFTEIGERKFQMGTVTYTDPILARPI